MERTDLFQVREISKPEWQLSDIVISKNQSPKAVELSDLIRNFSKAFTNHMLG